MRFTLSAQILRQLLPGRRLRIALAVPGLFIGATLVPFLIGSTDIPGDLGKLADPILGSKEDNPAQRPASAAGTSGPPDDFDPLSLDGAFRIGQLDADRAGWSADEARQLASDLWRQVAGGGQGYRDFHCGCAIAAGSGYGGTVDFTSCGFEPRQNTQRARRMEWELVVPAETIGRERQCWTEGAPPCKTSSGVPFKGEACCEIADPIYIIAATDPVNIVPAIGEVNGDRSGFPFGLIDGETRDYGACDIEIDPDHEIVEPAPGRRGDIARIHAYMSRSYGLVLGKDQADLYRRWMSDDPISPDEIAVNRAIDGVGHRPNPFVLEQD